MKKLSLYIFLGLFIFNSAYAEVYYCTDGANTGFNSKKDSYGTYSEDSVYFKPQRFTEHINFGKEILTSNESQASGTVPRSLKPSRILGFLNHPKAQGAHSGHGIGLIAYININAIKPGFPSLF